MKDFRETEKDFKRWISFNDQLNDFQKLYEFFTAIDTKKSFGNVSIMKESNEDEKTYHINQEGVKATLVVHEYSFHEILDYLVAHYFPDNEIEEWYQSKRTKDEKQINFNLPESNPIKEFKKPDAKQIKPFKKENKYFGIRLFFSVLFYMAIAGYVAFMSSISWTLGLTTLGIVLLVFLFFIAFNQFIHGIFIGLIKGGTIRITDRQYPEIFEIVRLQSEELGLKSIPEVYVMGGEFNAYVTKFARKKYLMLHSEVIETALRGDFEILKFVVGHELGHIHRRHLNKEQYLFPSRFIPFLSSAHSRACEYTCDRFGLHFSKEGAYQGIVILASGKDIYSKINMTEFMKNNVPERSFWVWVSEKFLSHPFTYKRLKAIANYDRKGY